MTRLLQGLRGRALLGITGLALVVALAIVAQRAQAVPYPQRLYVWGGVYATAVVLGANLLMTRNRVAALGVYLPLMLVGLAPWLMFSSTWQAVGPSLALGLPLAVALQE